MVRARFPLLVLVICSFAACDTLADEKLADGNLFTNTEDRMELSSHTGYLVEAQPGTVILADLDGDKRDELAIQYPAFDVVKVVNSATSAWATIPHEGPVFAADLYGDGSDELILVDQKQKTLRANLGKHPECHDSSIDDAASCLSTQPVTVECLESPVVIDFHDVDGDGRADLICRRILISRGGSIAGSELIVHLSESQDASAAPRFGPALVSALPEKRQASGGDGFVELLSPEEEDSIVYGDFDGDGHLDWAGMEESTDWAGWTGTKDTWDESLSDLLKSVTISRALLVSFGDGKGRFGAPVRAHPWTVQGVQNMHALPDKLMAADTSGDGADEIFVMGTSLEHFFSCTPGRKLTRQDATFNMLAYWPEAFAAGDIDGDGVKELIQVGEDLDFVHLDIPFMRLANTRGGSFQVLSNTRLPDDPGLSVSPSLRPYVGFTDDGRAEVALVNWRTPDLLVYRWSPDDKP
jgi:hypothetical protein